MTSDQPYPAGRLADTGRVMLDSQACTERAARLTEAAESVLAIAIGSDTEMRSLAGAWQRLAVIAGVQDVLSAALRTMEATPGTQDH